MKLHWNYCTLPLCVYPHPCLCGYKCMCDCTCTHAQGGCRPIWGIIPLVTRDRVCRWPWYIYLGWLSSGPHGPACIYCPYSRTVNIHHQWRLYIALGIQRTPLCLHGTWQACHQLSHLLCLRYLLKDAKLLSRINWYWEAKSDMIP